MALPSVTDGDTVHLRGGFTESVSTAKRLNFVGTSARGRKPVVEATNGWAFTLRGGGSISNLQVYGDWEGLAGAILLAPERAGTHHYSIADVVAIGGLGGVRSGTALEISDERAPGATIDADVGGGLFDSFRTGDGISVSGSNVSATLTRVGADGGKYCCGRGVTVSAGAEVFLNSSHVGSGSNRGPGLYVDGSGSSLRVARTRVATIGDALTVRNFDSGAATATVVDSLIASTWSWGRGALVQNGGTAGASATLEAAGTTFVTCCSGTQAGVALESHGSGGESRVAVTNTIIRAADSVDPPRLANADVLIRPNVDGGPAGSGVFTATYSNYRPASVDQSNGGAATATPPTGTNIEGDPLFVTPYGDFTLRANSPVIDRGDASIVKPGQLDLAGNPRSLDGNLDCIVAPDMGAYERIPQSVPCSPGQPSSGTTGGGTRGGGTRGGEKADTLKPIIDIVLSRRVFRAARRGGSIATAAGTTVRYTLSERANVRFKFERATRGRKVGRRCAKPRRRNRNNRTCRRYKRLKGSFSHQGDKGQNRFKLTGRLAGKKLKRGRYRLVARATDRAGNKSAPDRAAFRIVRH